VRLERQLKARMEASAANGAKSEGRPRTAGNITDFSQGTSPEKPTVYPVTSPDKAEPAAMPSPFADAPLGSIVDRTEEFAGMGFVITGARMPKPK